MPRLSKTLTAWNTTNFSNTFKQEAEGLAIEDLPLQLALQYGSCASKDNFQIMINNQHDDQHSITIDCGIFFSSTTPGCMCSDDPTPIDLNNEYGEFKFSINKSNAETVITVLS